MMEYSENLNTHLNQLMKILTQSTENGNILPQILIRSFKSNNQLLVNIIKNIELRYHDYSDTVFIVEPIIHYPNMEFQKLGTKTVNISSQNKSFQFKILQGDFELILGEEKENYWSPYPALRAYPIKIIIPPNEKGFINKIEFEIKIK